MGEVTHYEVLGVTNTASVAEIEEAYSRLLPNFSETPGLYRHIQQAHETLSDAVSRSAYDEAIQPARKKVVAVVTGRVVPVAVFGFLTVVDLANIPVGSPGVVAVVGRSIYVAFLGLTVTAFLTRGRPRARDGRVGAWVLAMTGSFGFAVAPVLPQGPRLFALGQGGQGARIILELVGSSLAVYTLLYLRRSFGLAPQARALVTGGPYRVIRHPLYVAEMLTVCGLIVATGTTTALVAGCVVIACEVGRAALEERLLARTFPDFDNRFAGVAHLVPGVW